MIAAALRTNSPIPDVLEVEEAQRLIARLHGFGVWEETVRG